MDRGWFVRVGHLSSRF
ncbi:hypothetical protein CFP56_038285 [Quercus suber]|uniref:Uncharacterized protein n=1 Tax=Quercus suber TaxID=58331 RepID=A0AAW0LNE9_QUESU